MPHFQFIVINLFGRFVAQCLMYPFPVVPYFYGLENLSFGFIKVFEDALVEFSGLMVLKNDSATALSQQLAFLLATMALSLSSYTCIMEDQSILFSAVLAASFVFNHL